MNNDTKPEILEPSGSGSSIPILSRNTHPSLGQIPLKLESNNIFRASQLDEAHDLIAKNISPHQIDVIRDKQDLDVHFKGICNSSISFLQIKYGATVRVSPSEARNFYFAQTVLRGVSSFNRGANEVIHNAGETVISSPDMPYHYNISNNGERLVIGIHKDILRKHLETLLFEKLSKPLIFDMSLASDQSSAIWHSYLNNIAQVIFSLRGNIRRNQLLLSHLESTMTTALTVFRHNYSDKLNDDPVDCDFNKLSRAVDYIHANIRNNLRLEDIARESGMSARSLQILFKKRFDATPLEYVRVQRLLAVKAELEVAPTGSRVTDIMATYGITSLGHFSAQYKEKFGCNPKDTLLHPNS